ncbi:TVP38/TMEM64 family protein [Alkalispirillum mobile]|uniref:TVP38/TMEM64 family protein n=1 Tax=Alkalispirillum mobile TaxID=85925 RepID=UPI000EB51EFC|nr:TVP38/TMEM64 family protein [Alkalispirillum mobile]
MRSTIKRKGPVVLGLLLVIAAAWALRDHLQLDMLRATLDDLGAWAPLAFMGAYAVAAVGFVPGSVFTLAGGVLFGPLWGTLYSLVGATLGAGLAFLVARHLAADWVARKAGGQLGRVIAGVEREGWRFVALTRLVPLFPFNLLNYALGLTRIPITHYLAATFICMAPGALAYTWLGYAGAEAIAGGERAIQAILIALALLALMLFLPRLIRRIRRQPLPDEHPPPTGRDL